MKHKHTHVPKKQQKHTKRYTAWPPPACAIPHAAPAQCDSSFVNHWSRVFQWPGTAAPPASRYRLFKCSIGERLKFMQGHWGCDNYNHRFLALQWQPFVIFTWVIPAAQGCWQACTDLVACSPLFPTEPPTHRPPLCNQPKLNQTKARDWHSLWDHGVFQTPAPCWSSRGVQLLQWRLWGGKTFCRVLNLKSDI